MLIRLGCKTFLNLCTRCDLLYVLGPVRGIAEGHEGAVGQDCAHDHKTEQRKQRSRNIHKENTHKYIQPTNQISASNDIATRFNAYGKKLITGFAKVCQIFERYQKLC